MTGRLREYAQLGFVFAALLWLVSMPTQANSVCITCDGPAAVYSCSYAPDANGYRPSHGGRTLQFACIQDVARQYQHASCSVRRKQLDVCNGQVHMMSQAPAALPLAPPPARIGTSVPERDKAGTKREPKTVVEFAQRTARNTKKQFDKSVRKVSKAARSTWRCVSTLFSKC